MNTDAAGRAAEDFSKVDLSEPQNDTAPGEADSSKQEGDTVSEDGPESSYENIIPFGKLRKGWFAISGMVMEAASEARKKAEETYNSDDFKAVRDTTNEYVVPAWEKTCEVAVPIWEKAKASASVAIEKTKENAGYVAEQVKPAIDDVSHLMWTLVSMLSLHLICADLCASLFSVPYLVICSYLRSFPSQLRKVGKPLLSTPARLRRSPLNIPAKLLKLQLNIPLKSLLDSRRVRTRKKRIIQLQPWTPLLEVVP